MFDVNAELSPFFESWEVDAQSFERVSDLALQSFETWDRFAELLAQYRARVEQGQGDPLKLALGLLVLGRSQEALDWFGRTPDGKFRRYYAARAALGLGRYDQALEEWEQAAAKGLERFEIDMRMAEVHLRRGDVSAALRLANKQAQAGVDRADWYYVQGLLKEQQDDWIGAAEKYEKALTLAPDHNPAKFRCAWLYDIHGDDERAIQLYESLALQPRAHVNALINVAVIYEDIGRYQAAEECLRRVLKAFPNHTRARLFLKDVRSCMEMVVEEAGDAQETPRDRVLDAPIAEFELSVRARNSLKRMSIRTLGDLVKLSEPELLSLKNFGDQSLTEIKTLLAKRGLELGQYPADVEGAAPEEGAPRVVVPPGREPVLAKPVSELELSVRARRCLQRLNVVTLGDLIQLSEQDLLAARNFGVTSLNEIKARLAEQGLQLATKRAS